ncbi:DUF3307 domain-containing protein [Roseivirga pacifica]|uniref:DUF3307 domain-containing protein n=1 Tax=Roseivirga pacifica TaxID=1267423 RepID=UPI00227A22DD|nr:DUF3307 domain-containing protein [Roseivirga pacifica]
MTLSTVLLLQVIAHVLSDFYFQTDQSVAEKLKHGAKSKTLYKHIAITFALSWLLSFSPDFVFNALIIAATHYFIDLLKPRVQKIKSIGNYAFFIDQAIHIVVILLVTDLRFAGNNQPIFSINPQALQAILIYLIALKPTNIIIKEVFKTYQIETPQTDDLPNAGKLIGSLERILIITLSIAGRLEAVGFLIAAKSILRYKDTDNLKTEYVLIGTLLSFGIATILSLWFMFF